QAQRVKVGWHDYPLGHEVCLEELHDIGAWLRKRL
ncbi:alpha/beta hydrolase, partial [Pseudomonas aeruginosa]